MGLRPLLAAGLALAARVQQVHAGFLDATDPRLMLVERGKIDERYAMVQEWARNQTDMTLVWYDYRWSDPVLREDIGPFTAASYSPDIIAWFAGGDTVRELVETGGVADLHDFYLENDLYNKIPQNFIDAVSGDDGLPYALPTEYTHYGMYYNKNTLATLGIEPPETWDQFLAACQIAKDAGVVPITFGTKWLWPLGAWFDYLDMRLNGPDFHKNLTKGRVRMDDPKVRNVWAHFLQLVRKGFVLDAETASSFSWYIAAKMMAEGTGAFTLMADFVRTDAPAEAIPNIDFFQFPIIDDTVPIGEVAPTDGYILNNKCVNKTLAKRALALFATPEFQTAWPYSWQTPVSLDAVVTDPGKLKGINMLKAADATVQFLDRDMRYQLASQIMYWMSYLHAMPSEEVLDGILQTLEVERRRIYLGVADMPAADVVSGTYTEEISIKLTTNTDGAKIYFTLDGSLPGTESEEYNSDIGITLTDHGRTVLRAIAVAPELKRSPVMQETYNMVLFVDKFETIDDVATVAMAIGDIGIAVILVLTALTVKHRTTPVFRATSPLFVIIMLVGALIAVSAVFTLSMPVTPEMEGSQGMCMVSIWLFNIGWGLTFGALLFKTYRIVKIFGNTSLRKVRVADALLLRGVLFVVLIEASLTMAWQLAGPMVIRKVSLAPETDPWLFAMQCVSDAPIFNTLAVGVKAAMVLVAIMMCFMTRNVNSAFNESRSIGFAVYQLAVVGASSLGLSSVMTQVDIAHLVRCAGLVMTALVIVSTITVPKLSIVYFRPEQNTTKSWLSPPAAGRTTTAAIDSAGFTATQGMGNGDTVNFLGNNATDM